MTRLTTLRNFLLRGGSADSSLASVIFRWRTMLVLVAAIVVVAAAFVADANGAPVNLATEAVGMIVSTYLTVGLIDEMRRRRDRNSETDARRYRLINELSFNLSRQVRRRGSSAHPTHQMMSQLRQQRPLFASEISPTSTVEVTQHQANQILFSLLGRVRASHFSRNAIDEAVTSGAFLQDERGELTEGPLHAALTRIQGDIDRLSATDTPFGDSQPWDSQLLSDVMSGRGHENRPVAVGAFSLVRAYAHHDLAENLLLEQTAVLRHLLRIKDPYVAPPRMPGTPLGPVEEERIRSELVTSQ